MRSVEDEVGLESREEKKHSSRVENWESEMGRGVGGWVEYEG